MPSPLGHALGGVAAGLLVSGSAAAAPQPAVWRLAGIFALFGVAPDLDLLIGIHSGPTHGVGAALVAGVLAYALGREGLPVPRARFALACALAYASHTLLDWLGTDTSAPIGIMALWPFTVEHFQSDLQMFPAVSRRIGQPHLFWAQNARAVLVELLILGPVAFSIVLLRRRL